MSREALRRAARARDVQALGPPLAARVRTSAVGGATDEIGSAVRSPHVAGAALAATALVLPLAGAPLVALAGAAPFLYAAGYLIARAWRRRQALSSAGSEIELAEAFDAFAAANAAALPADAAAALHRIKSTLGKVLSRSSSPHARAALGPDDAFFVSQAVCRYLPDAVEPFRALPPDRVDEPLAGQARTPHEALVEQLGIVEKELGRIEELLVRAEAERLARNQLLLERRRPR